MTRDEAVKIWRTFGIVRSETDIRQFAPQHLCDRWIDNAVGDEIDGLIALGILKVEEVAP